MARYNLIIRDDTYVLLVALAQKQGLSLGKFLNNCLNQLTKNSDSVTPSCFLCEAKPTIQVMGLKDTFYLCRAHERFKNVGKGYRELTSAAAV